MPPPRECRSPDSLDLHRCGAVRRRTVPEFAVRPVAPTVDATRGEQGAVAPGAACQGRHPGEGAAPPDTLDLHRGGAARGCTIAELAIGPYPQQSTPPDVRRAQKLELVLTPGLLSPPTSDATPERVPVPPSPSTCTGVAVRVETVAVEDAVAELAVSAVAPAVDATGTQEPAVRTAIIADDTYDTAQSGRVQHCSERSTTPTGP